MTAPNAVESVKQRPRHDPIRLITVVLNRNTGGVYRVAGPFRSLHAAERWGEVNGTYDGFPAEWFVTDLETP